MKGVKIPWESEGEQDSDAPFFFCLLDAQLCAKSDNRKWRKKKKKKDSPPHPFFLHLSLFFLVGS
jgi:hypothetical protein